MAKIFTKRSRAQYPFVVEPVEDRWLVLFVRTERPFRVAEFDEREQAFSHMRSLNKGWWAELHALTETRLLLERVRETSALQHASNAPASLWQRVKAILRLP